MKQVIANYKGNFQIENVPVPLLKNNGMLVLNRFSLISPGTERHTIGMSKKGLIGKAKECPDQFQQVMNSIKKDGLIETYKIVKDRLELPMPLGYSCSGSVWKVSGNISGITAGDKVACAGAGYASHAEVVYVPANMCAKVPDNVSLEAAAFTALGAIAMQSVRQAGIQVGESVAVIGLGLVGLLVIQILKAAGCNVLGVDIDPGKLQLASDLEIDLVALSSDDNVDRAALDFSKGWGLDTAIITAATSSSEPVALAGRILRDKGRVVVVGNVGMEIPRRDYYEKELDLRLSRSYGPGRYDPIYEEKGIDYPIGYVRWTEKRNMESFLKLLSKGSVNVDKLITHKFKIDDAEKAYDVILGKTGERSVGVLLECEAKDNFETKVLLISKDELGTKPGREQSSKGNVELGFIGAGSFARAFLLPNLKDNDSVIFRGVATGSSVNSKHVARKYKFQYCTTDYNEILQDQEVMAVVVATRHNLHAKIVIEAIKAHKAVFVEKPLAISEDELIDVIQTWKDNEGRIMVGFNRRFSPFIEQVKSFFSDRTQPLAINYRINAGSVAKEHWVQDADQGGGRIIGEVCHFVDLLQFLVGSQPLRIFAESISANSEAVVDNDNISITLKFADGSIGNVSYLANGDSSFPKERIEIFGDGSIAVIDDFKELQLIKKGKTEKIKKRGQNKGHRKELRMFVNAVKNGEDMPIPFRDSVVATTLTFMIHKSLREGIPLDVDLERFGL